MIVADDPTREAIERLRAIHRQQEALETERETLEDRCKLAMGDAQALMIGEDVAVTWRTTKPGPRFDQKAFKAAEPAQYKAWCRMQSMRKFLLRGIADDDLQDS